MEDERPTVCVCGFERVIWSRQTKETSQTITIHLHHDRGEEKQTETTAHVAENHFLSRDSQGKETQEGRRKTEEGGQGPQDSTTLKI